MSKWLITVPGWLLSGSERREREPSRRIAGLDSHNDCAPKAGNVLQNILWRMSSDGAKEAAEKQETLGEITGSSIRRG